MAIKISHFLPVNSWSTKWFLYSHKEKKYELIRTKSSRQSSQTPNTQLGDHSNQRSNTLVCHVFLSFLPDREVSLNGYTKGRRIQELEAELVWKIICQCIPLCSIWTFYCVYGSSVKNLDSLLSGKLTSLDSSELYKIRYVTVHSEESSEVSFPRSVGKSWPRVKPVC